MRLHDLRHSAATILPAAGVPERVVMEILGHSTLAMVKRYQHVLPGLTVAAAERMDRVDRGHAVLRRRARAPSYDWRPQLRGITIRTRVIVGKHDWVCPPADSRVIASGIPGAIY